MKKNQISLVSHFRGTLMTLGFKKRTLLWQVQFISYDIFALIILFLFYKAGAIASIHLSIRSAVLYSSLSLSRARPTN